MPRMLIVKTSSLGDVIHNLPILADIRAHQPDMQFDWVVEEGFTDVPALHPAVENVIAVAVRRWRRRPFATASRQEILACKARLRAVDYDWILDTQGLLKSAWIARWASGVRHGYHWRSAREPLASLFYQRHHQVDARQHAVTRNRALAALALGYLMPTSPPDYGIAATAANPIVTTQPYVVGLHATSRASKLWPVAHWIALAGMLQQRGLALILPWGSAAERQRADEIASQAPNVVAPDRLRLSAIAALLSHARAAIGVDTGLTHLAVALNLPTVAIYTDTLPALTGVMPQHAERTRNLGGPGSCPSSDAVMAALDAVAPLARSIPGIVRIKE